MLTRVSDNMKFKTLTDNMFSVQSKYADLEEKLATQKQVNRPSDNPVGMAKILDYRATRASIAKYQNNVDQSSSWLTMTESNLSGIQDQLVNAKEIAIAQATATSDSSSRQTAAASLQPIIDEVLSLANAKLGDRYLFSGSATTTAPFSTTASPATVAAASSAGDNAFNGTVTSGGAYTGTTNKTYAVKVINGGPLATATYQVSADGGKTWGTTQTDLSNPITLGDGITLSFAAGSVNPAANDIFYASGKAAGYYNGNGEEMTVGTAKGIDFGYNITGEAALTSQGAGTADTLTALNNLKTALLNNDVAGIQTSIDTLEAARAQVSQYVSECGNRSASLDITKSNLSTLDQNISSLNSNVEDADMASLITDFTAKQTALQASYSIAGQISKLSIINFLS